MTQQNIDMKTSIVSLFELLLKIQKSPTSLSEDEELLKALASQGRLAKYSNSQLGIVPMSLNTQKAHSELALPLGYSALNVARVAALESYIRHQSKIAPPKTSTKANLLARVDALEREVFLLEGDLAVFTDVLNKSLMLARSYADSAGQVVVDRCKKEQMELLALLGVRSKPRLRAVP